MPRQANPKDPLLQPFQLKHLKLKNRIMSTSHACGLEEGGKALDAYQLYHEEKAKGGLALTMFGGSSNVSPDSPNTFQQLYVGDDSCIEWMQRFSERVHAHDCALMIQITHMGRRGETYKDNIVPAIAPSPIRETLHRSIPRQMDEHDIARVVQDFANAARRCKDGGLDGLETLAGGHLIGQFLSPATNKRTDSYGGSLANRCRFGLMVYEAIRKAAGDDFIVGFRYIIDEGMAGGLSFDECVEIAGIFERSGFIDFFNAVYGRMDTAHGLAMDNMPGMSSPIAPWLQKAAAFKREVNLPVFHAARITDVATARYAIQEGLIDMAAMTRAHIADPHLVNKLAAGEEDRIRPCVGVTHCMSDLRPSCIHNPSSGREAKLPHKVKRAPKPRKIVIVGGGPAGLEAARVCLERGHGVVLFEASSRTGGQVQLAQLASWRKDVIAITDWRQAEVERLGGAIRLNTYAETEDILAENPDVVILATGGVPDFSLLEGHEHVLSAWDVLTGEAPAGDVLVYDGTGRHSAATAAERIAMAGTPVKLVTIDDTVMAEIAYAERVIWKKRIYQLGIETARDRNLKRVERDGNRLKAIFENEVTGETGQMTADHIVVEQGTLPAGSLFEDLKDRSVNDGVMDLKCLLEGRRQLHDGSGFELYRIGDAAASRNIHAAVLDALRLCRVL